MWHARINSSDGDKDEEPRSGEVQLKHSLTHFVPRGVDELSLQGAPTRQESGYTDCMGSQQEPFPKDLELPVFRLVRGPTAVHLSDTQLVVADSSVN